MGIIWEKRTKCFGVKVNPEFIWKVRTNSYVEEVTASKCKMFTYKGNKHATST